MTERPILLPCPFCGSENLELAEFYGGYRVECLDCVTQGPALEIKSVFNIGLFSETAQHLAMEKWNMRTPQEVKGARDD